MAAARRARDVLCIPSLPPPTMFHKLQHAGQRLKCVFMYVAESVWALTDMQGKCVVHARDDSRPFYMLSCRQGPRFAPRTRQTEDSNTGRLRGKLFPTHIHPLSGEGWSGGTVRR